MHKYASDSVDPLRFVLGVGRRWFLGGVVAGVLLTLLALQVPRIKLAAGVGLIVSDRGDTQYVPKNESPFLQLIERYGVVVPDAPQKVLRIVGRSKQKKWYCACPTPFNIRVARANFRALCLYCQTEFGLAVDDDQP